MEKWKEILGESQYYKLYDFIDNSKCGGKMDKALLFFGLPKTGKTSCLNDVIREIGENECIGWPGYGVISNKFWVEKKLIYFDDFDYKNDMYVRLVKAVLKDSPVSYREKNERIMHTKKPISNIILVSNDNDFSREVLEYCEIIDFEKIFW